MIELFGAILVAIILATLGIFGWFKYCEEKQRYNKLSAEHMRLEMENYNMTVRMNKVIPIDNTKRSEP